MSNASRVLLLEDNPTDRQFMKICLNDHARASVQLSHAGRVAEARDHLRRHDYELVIADLNVPDGEGLETFFRIKEMAADAAIVVLTGVDDTDLAMRAVRAGAQDYLVKGELPAEKVWRCLSNALERHVRQRQLSGITRTLRKENDNLRQLSQTDPLTGLYNRNGIQKELSHQGLWASPYGSAILVDVDGFREINDLFGYGQGDAALKEVAQRIHSQMRLDDLAARIGGDEFLVVLPSTTMDAALAMAERIRASVAEKEIPSQDGAFRVTVSLGVASVAQESLSLERLLNVTHDAIRMSKGGGKNKVCHMEALQDKTESMICTDVTVLSRPFYNLADGHVAGYEFSGPEWSVALSAEGTRESIRRRLKAAARHGEGLECHICLSHAELLYLRPNDLAEALPAGMERRRVRLSVAAIPISPLPPGMVDAVRRLQEAGWAFALHDLELGMHSWANLILLQPALVTLKSDMVSGALADPGRTRNLVRVCRAMTALGAYVVATGVENGEDLNLLACLGVPYGRGRLWEGDPQ